MFFILNNTGSVYAESFCSDEMGSIIHIDDSGNITFPEHMEEEATASWDRASATLTLDNYHGAPICSDLQSNMTIIVRNTNSITATRYGAIKASGNLIFNGDGELQIDATPREEDKGANIIYTVGFTIIESGTIDVNVHSFSTMTDECNALLANGLIVNGGNFSSDCAVYMEDKGFAAAIINGGNISVGAFQVASGFINQNGGTLEIAPSSYFETEIDMCFFAARYYFNGGKTTIDCSEYGQGQPFAMVAYLDQDPNDIIASLGDIPYNVDQGVLTFSLQDRFGEYVPDITASISLDTIALFKDGDIEIQGPYLAIAGILEICDKKDTPELCNRDTAFLDDVTLFQMSNNLVIEPSMASLDYVILEDSEGKNAFFTLTDGTSGTYVNIDPDTGAIDLSPNILKKVHIHKTAPIPVPSTDDTTPEPSETEANPYTIDSHLFSIISTILVSIVAEVFIIIDLKKRINNTQDQIVETETKTLFDPIDSISSKPEEKP